MKDLQNLIIQNLNDSFNHQDSNEHQLNFDYTIDALSFYMQGWSCFLFD